MSAEHDKQERAPAGPLLPGARRAGGSPVAIGTLGEGLLEVGIDAGFDEDCLGRGYGGDAANVAVMAANMGIQSYLLTRVGDDAVGHLLMDFWARRGVDVSRVSVDREASTGLYVNDGRDPDAHSFTYCRSRSAASRLAPEDIGDHALDGLDLLHLSGITLSISPSAAAAAEAAVDSARQAGAAVAFDVNFRRLLDADPEAILAMARRADIVLLATADAESVVGSSAPEHVLEALGPTPREVVITRGPDEAMLFTREATYALAPPPVEIVNTAGAGDALAGAYVASRLDGAAAPEALARAVAAASLSCRRPGCARGYPDGAEVEAEAAGLEAEVRPPLEVMASTAGPESRPPPGR